MSVKDLQQIQFEACRLAALLENIQHTLPNDTPDGQMQPHLLVGWATDIANQIATDLDVYELNKHQSER